MRKAPGLSLFTLFVCQSVVAQDALRMLQDASAHISELPKSSYDFELVETHEFFTPLHTKTEIHRRMTGSGGKYRQEMPSYGMVYVFDGQFRWTYSKGSNEYEKTPVAKTSELPIGLLEFSMAGPTAKSAKLLRQETLELASGPVVCQVIEVEGESSGGQMKSTNPIYWVDQSRNLILKQSQRRTFADPHMPAAQESVTTLTITKATVGEPVDQSLLQFIPPDGAVDVERVTVRAKSPMIGGQAPDFELQGIDCKAITSTSLRGGFVLLYFGQQLEDETVPLLELMNRSLKSNGLTTIHVLPQRDAKTGSTTYTIPLAIDPAGSVAKKFGFSYQGEVLLDRAGKILYATRLSPNSVELAKALQKAGVW
jgi:outer membrane lipoprotein-sorting protein